MSDYKFSVATPPSLEEQGIAFVIHHPEFPDVLKSYNISIPMPPKPNGPLGFVGYNWPDTIKGVLKRQYVWKRLGEVRTIATTQTLTVTETVTQSLTQTRSLRALVRLAVGVEANGPFVSASAELTAEVEGTIEAQENWTKETTHARTIETQPNRTYAFWNLLDRVSFSYSSSDLQSIINQVQNMIDANRNVKGDKTMIADFTNYLNKLKALKDMEHKFELLLHYNEDAMDDDVALLASMQGF